MRLTSKPTIAALALTPLLALGPSMAAAPAAAAGARPASQTAPTRAHLAGLPLTFQPNRGQAPPDVRYLGQTQGLTALFTRTGVTLQLTRPAHRGAQPDTNAGSGAQAQVTLAFLHPSPQVRVTAASRQAGTVNYILGKTKAGWHTGIPTYAQVVYHNLWPGITAGFTASGGTLRYWFTLTAAASASQIRLAYTGANSLRIGPSGALAITTPAGVLHDQAPATTQTLAGHQAPLASRYRLLGGTRFGFTLTHRSPSAEVTIDPGLEYGTYLGGSVADSSLGSPATDSAGDLYVFGETASPDFPTTPGAYQRTFTAKVGGVFFVAKLNSTGTGLIYSTFVGGTGFQGLAHGTVDSAGDAYVTGETDSADFPVTPGAYRTTPYMADTQSVVFKLNPTGSKLVYSTYLAPGLISAEDGRQIALVPDGSVIVIGITDDDWAPTTPGAFQTTYPGGINAGYVVRLNPTGSGLIYATYLGAPVTHQVSRDNAPVHGDPECAVTSVAVGGQGSAYLTAVCEPGFPTTPGAYLAKSGNSTNGNPLLVKLAPGGRLDYATYWAAPPLDSTGTIHEGIGPVGVAVDRNGDAYVTGNVPGKSIPVTAGAYQTNCTPYDPTKPFPYCVGVAEFNPTGTSLLYGSYFGGQGSDNGPADSGMTMDASGHMYLVGQASTGDIPITSGAYEPEPGNFVIPFFLAVLGKGTLLYSTYFGGAGQVCFGIFCGTAGTITIAPDPGSGSVYLSGTAETGMPISPGAFQQTYPGGIDSVWAAKLGLPSFPPGG